MTQKTIFKNIFYHLDLSSQVSLTCDASSVLRWTLAISNFLQPPCLSFGGDAKHVPPSVPPPYQLRGSQPCCKLGLQGERNEQEYDREKAKHIPIREEEIYLTNVFMHIKFSKNAPLNQEKTILHYFTKLCLNRASLVLCGCYQKMKCEGLSEFSLVIGQDSPLWSGKGYVNHHLQRASWVRKRGRGQRIQSL